MQDTNLFKRREQAVADLILSAKQNLTAPSGSQTFHSAPGSDDDVTTIVGPAAGPAGVAQWVGDTAPPGVPAGLDFSTSNGQILAAWDGTLHGDIPEDMGGIEVLAQGQPVGRLTAAGSLLVAGFPAGTAVAMSARSYDRARAQDGTPAPNFSEPSTAVQVTVAEIVDGSAAIVETMTEYATTTDPATAPTAGWSQTAPAWVSGQYIWVRTTITHGDGSTNTTDPVVVTGNPGATGAQGATGPAGPKGATGATGPAGAASYTHIAYADTATGTGFDQDPSGHKWIGIYVDQTAADSSDPSKYTWSKFVGDDGQTGATGAPGAAGVNGQTPYFHTAYSTSATGSTGFSTTNPTGATYLGSYTDYTAADSTTPSDYTWAKFQGPTGAQGATGPAGATGVGVSSVTRWFYMGTSKPSVPATAPASPWTTTEPGYVAGSTLYYVDIVTYSDGTKSVTPVQTMSSYLYAATAYQTAAGMVKAYIAQPAPPYKVGDIWKNGATLYVCTTGRSSGSYTASDWTRAGDVTASNINGVTITGSVVQSSAANPRSWQDSTGFHQTDSSGNRVFDTTAGQTPLLVGGFKTALTGNRVEINTYKDGYGVQHGQITFIPTDNIIAPGFLESSVDDSGGGTAFWRSPLGDGNVNAASVDLTSGDGVGLSGSKDPSPMSSVNMSADMIGIHSQMIQHINGDVDLDVTTKADLLALRMSAINGYFGGGRIRGHVSADSTAANNGDYVYVGNTWVPTLCYASLSVTSTIKPNTAAEYTIPFQGSVLRGMTASSGVITVPVAGTYRISANVFFEWQATGQYRDIWVAKNGSNLLRTNTSPGGDGNTAATAGTISSFLTTLSAGDQISLHTFGSSATWQIDAGRGTLTVEMVS